MSLKEAFFTVCDDAKPASSHYVSLYCKVPFYGGPEEGGWWSHDVTLIAYQLCMSEEEAVAKKQAVHNFAHELNKEEKVKYGELCLREMEWLDSRGLDADYLPEVDGESEYFVVIENVPGSHANRGCRHYE